MIPPTVTHQEKFQSTLPLRGATLTLLGNVQRKEISIHAPLTGSDRQEAGVGPPPLISIHAPLTGSDRDLPF